MVRNFEASLAVLDDFADVVEDLELPDFPYDAAASVIIDAEAASAFEPLFESGRITELTAPEDRLGGYAGAGGSGQGLPAGAPGAPPGGSSPGHAARGCRCHRGPDLPTVAWPLDTPFDKVYPDFPGGTSIGGAANLSGVPGLFLMNGVGEGGLPTSLQLTGRALREEPLLAIGIRYQERTSFHRQRPPGL